MDNKKPIEQRQAELELLDTLSFENLVELLALKTGTLPVDQYHDEYESLNTIHLAKTYTVGEIVGRLYDLVHTQPTEEK